jgi:hypothetical protein
MQQWEYCSLVIDRNHWQITAYFGGAESLRIHPVLEPKTLPKDGTEKRKSFARAQAAALTQLGAEGWEGFTTMGDTLYFKRPKPTP